MFIPFVFIPMHYPDRPKIKLEKRLQDWVIEVTSLIGVLLMIGLPVWYYSSLPDTIPVHFNASGVADRYGSKGTLLLLPIFGTFMFIGLYALAQAPHIFNYPTEITEENAEKQYRNGKSLIRWINMIMVFSFAFIEWRVIDSCMKGQGNLGPYFMPIFMISIFGAIAYFFWKSRN